MLSSTGTSLIGLSGEQKFLLMQLKANGGPYVQEDILRCIYSISDNNSYLLFNRDPVDRIIDYLRQHFRPDGTESGASLAISGGLGGARLTHSHERQYHYVLQSLTLWREISHEVGFFPPALSPILEFVVF